MPHLEMLGCLHPIAWLTHSFASFEGACALRETRKRDTSECLQLCHGGQGIRRGGPEGQGAVLRVIHGLFPIQEIYLFHSLHARRSIGS